MKVIITTISDIDNLNFTPFEIELDGLDEEEYIQKAARGVFKHSKTGTVTSSRCKKCGHVRLGELPAVCGECGSYQFQTKETDETWAIIDSDDIPEKFIGGYDLKPSFWAYKDFLEDAVDLDPEYINALIDEGLETDDLDLDLSDVYKIEHISEEEIQEQCAELYPNEEDEEDDAGVFQDWPVKKSKTPAIDHKYLAA